MYKQIKGELVQMLGTDTSLLHEKTRGMPEATVAVLRTTRISTMEEADAPCNVQSSEIHGKGLFATKEINKGDMITMYPIDVSVYETKDPETSAHKALVCYSQHPTPESLAPEVVGNTILENRAYAHAVAANGMPLTMALETATKHDPSHLGHWANDAVCYAPLEEDAESDAQKQSIKEYEEESYNRSNAEHLSVARGIFVITVAKRDITVGEEITVKYGVDWWSSWHRHVEWDRRLVLLEPSRDGGTSDDGVVHPKDSKLLPDIRCD
jgi:hypothetical protein